MLYQPYLLNPRQTTGPSVPFVGNIPMPWIVPNPGALTYPRIRSYYDSVFAYRYVVGIDSTNSATALRVAPSVASGITAGEMMAATQVGQTQPMNERWQIVGY